MRWARDITHFSGYAGEVIRGAIYPGIWLTLFPVLVVWAGFTLFITVVLNVSPELSDPLGPIVGYLITSFLVGRFAVGAAQGDVNSGFLNPNIEFGDSIMFVVRSSLLFLIWQLPLYGIIELTGATVNMTDLGFSGAGMLGMLLLFLFFLMLVGFPLTWLLASVTSSVGEIFSSQPWVYVFTVRRRDIPTYLASVVGGGFLFFGLYFIPSYFVGQMYFQFVVSMTVADPNMARMIGSMLGWVALPLVPAMASTIIIGRLCGAFIQGHGTFDEAAVASDFAVPSSESEIMEQVESSPPGELPSSAVDMAQHDGSSEEYLPEDEPSDEVITWVKEVAAEVAEISSVSVLRHSAEGVSESTICLAVDIDAGTKLARQQEVKKIIQEKSPPGKLVFVNPHNEEMISSVGTLVYRRK